MDDDFDKLLALHKDIRNSKEYKAIKGLRENETSFRLFLRNYHELMRLLHIVENIPTAIRLWDVKKRDAFGQVLEEVTFLLHNYVASVMSLVDHTRVLHERLYENEHSERLEVIQTEINKRFVNNETHQLVQGLRNYTLHRKLPSIGGRMSYTAGDTEFDFKYVISAKSLLDWDGWKPLAKRKLDKLSNLSIEERFIEYQKQDISISQLITAHHKEVVSFYKWLGIQQKQWHKEDEKILREKGKTLEQLEKPGLNSD